MMQLPNRIRVGPFDYTVEDWDHRLAESARRMGECDRVLTIIRVRTDTPPQRIAETLWHEVLHAAWDATCCDDKEEEAAVSAMSMMQCQIWRDNPELIAFMSAALAPRGDD